MLQDQLPLNDAGFPFFEIQRAEHFPEGGGRTGTKTMRFAPGHISSEEFARSYGFASGRDLNTLIHEHVNRRGLSDIRMLQGVGRRWDRESPFGPKIVKSLYRPRHDARHLCFQFAQQVGVTLGLFEVAVKAEDDQPVKISRR